jgi:hypothetical protein
MSELKSLYDICNGKVDSPRELKALLQAHQGVDVNLYQTANGWRALHASAARGHAACARLLIDAKADMEVRSRKGATPLYFACGWGHLECVQVLLSSNADVAKAADNNGMTPAHAAADHGHSECLDLLIKAGADVNARTNDDATPAMGACQEDRLACLQLLVDGKADLSARSNQAIDALYGAIDLPRQEHAHRVSGMPFAVLSCNTDSENVATDGYVPRTMVDTHVKEYTQIHNFIDEYHGIIKHTLSEDVVVDKRVLEQVLLYLGLSMDKTQAANTSIDGKSGVTRALMPGNPLNANVWFQLYQHTLCSNCSARLMKPKKCPCRSSRYCNTDCQRQHWQTHKADHKFAMLKKSTPPEHERQPTECVQK